MRVNSGSSSSAATHTESISSACSRACCRWREAVWTAADSLCSRRSSYSESHWCRLTVCSHFFVVLRAEKIEEHVAQVVQVFERGHEAFVNADGDFACEAAAREDAQPDEGGIDVDAAEPLVEAGANSAARSGCCRSASSSRSNRCPARFAPPPRRNCTSALRMQAMSFFGRARVSRGARLSAVIFFICGGLCALADRGGKIAERRRAVKAV